MPVESPSRQITYTKIAGTKKVHNYTAYKNIWIQNIYFESWIESKCIVNVLLVSVLCFKCINLSICYITWLKMTAILNFKSDFVLDNKKFFVLFQLLINVISKTTSLLYFCILYCVVLLLITYWAYVSHLHWKWENMIIRFRKNRVWPY